MNFSSVGLLLGLCAFFGGAGFLMPYLLILSIQIRGHISSMLLGHGLVGAEDTGWAT